MLNLLYFVRRTDERKKIKGNNLRNKLQKELFLHSQQLVDIHVVILHKEEGAGLGFSIAGGSDLESKAATVSSPRVLSMFIILHHTLYHGLCECSFLIG